MNRLEQLALMVLVALLPFQDTGLQHLLRTFGASLSVIPLLLLLTLALVRRIHDFDWRVPRAALYCLFYVLTLTGVYLLLFGVSIHGTSLFSKSLSLFIILGVFTFAAWGPNYTESRFLWLGAMAGFALTLIAAVVGPALDGNGLLHATVNLDARPRGFCTESSTFSVQVVISGLLAAYVARKVIGKIILLSLTASLLIHSGSKGGLITLILCASAYWIMRYGLSPLKLLGGGLVILPVAYGLAGLISRGFENDMISNGSSVATRGTMLLFSFITLMHNPFGVGFSGFYPSLARYLPAAMQSVRSILDIPLVFNEVSTYRYNIEDADCKTFFLDLMVMFGIPFVLLFFTFFFRLCRKLYREGEHVLLIGALFSATALLSYYSTINAYSVPVFLGICLSRHAKNSTVR